MKKLLKIIYMLLLPLYSAFGQGQIGVSIHDTTMVVGDTMFVPVYVDSTLTGRNVSSYNLQLSFNSTYFVVDSAFSDGTISEGWGEVYYNTNTAGKISVVSAGATDLTGTGKLLYIRLRALRAAALNLSFTDTTNNFFNEGTPRILLDYGRIVMTAKPTIRISPNSETLTTGDTKQFSVSYGSSPYVWGVTNTSVASIDENGMLTATGKGTTQVVAQDANGIIDTTDGVVEIRAFKLSTRDTSHYQGQTVDIPIYTTDLNGLNYTAGEFTLTINENVLTPLEIITTGTILGGYTTPSFGFNDGKLKIAFAGDTPLSGSGVLLVVRYQITSVNTSATYLTFSDILFNEADNGNGVRSYFRTLALATLNISPSTGNLLAGETLQFSASNGTEPYSWSVSNPTLASIDATGLLTAINGGVVTVNSVGTFGGYGSSSNINLYDTEVSIPDTTAELGSFIDLPLYMSDLSSGFSIIAMQTGISFDSSKVKFDQVITTGTSTDGWSFSVNNMGNKVSIAGASTTGFNTAGAIVKLRFSVSQVATIGHSTNVTLYDFLFNEGSPNARIDNGRITIAISSAPTAPSGLTAAVTGSNEISLSWADNSNNESGFKIERKTGNAGTWSQVATVLQNVTTFNNSGLSVSTEYYYRVTSYNGVGNSAYSNEANATTSDVIPNAPTNVVGVNSDTNSITLTWEDNSDNEIGFKIERAIDTSISSAMVEIATVQENITTFIDTNLLETKRYFYRVRSYNSGGNSDYSNESNEIIMPLLRPSDLTGEVNIDEHVALLWVDNSSAETRYELYRKIGASSLFPIATLDSNATSFIDSNVVFGETYTYRVAAYSGIISSGPSEEFTITLTGVDSENNIPTKYELSQNYPNPFNPSTMIRFGIPEASFVNITIYNLLGEKIGNLLNEDVGAGFHEMNWNAANIPSGVYLISIRFESNVSNQNHSFTKKAILLK